MNGRSFELRGAEELARDFQKVVADYPDESAKEVFRLSGVFTKDVNKKMPASYQNGKKSIPKKWRRTRARALGGKGAVVSVEIQNTAPHWHLVENGHEVWATPEMYAALKTGKLKKGKTEGDSRRKSQKLKNYGFAPGKHYCEKTRDEWNGGEYAKHVSAFVNKMLDKNNL